MPHSRTPVTAWQIAASPPAVREDPLLDPKFRLPSAPPDLVVRRRLLELVDRGVQLPLTLVSAPAGYGKTVLVASWAAQADPSTVVLPMLMDDQDESLVGFWASAVEGLRRVGVDVAGVRVATSASGIDRWMGLSLARRIAAFGQPVVWVLDTGEALLSPAVAAGLHRLLHDCAGRLRLVLLTRVDPPLPLHRYRLDDAIVEVRAEDLAFTATEVAALMQRAGLDLEAVDVAALRDRTAGWPAGLRFAMMSLAGRADTRQAIREFRGDTSNVAAYLMSEVLAKQPPEMREFLLRTCLVDQLDPGLVSALTGRPLDVRVLRFIAHGNAFIEPVPARPGCYRYQPLFREFLRSQLMFEDPDSVPGLHRAAAAWLAQEGRLPAAIRHAVAAGDWTTATRYVVEGLCFAGLLTGDRRAVSKDLFARLPADTAGAEAAGTRATLALVELDTDRCALELRRARALLVEDDPARARSCALAVAVLEAVVASMGPDLERGLDAALAAEYAVQSAPAEDHLASLELRAVVAGCTGRVMVQRGDLAAARVALAEGIRAAETARLDATLRELVGMAALVEAMSGNLRLAAELAARSGLHTDDSGSSVVPLCPAAALALAWVCTDRYDLQTAWELLGHVERAAPSYDARPTGAVLALLRARLLCAHGEFAVARARLRAVRTSVDGARSTGWLDCSLVLAQAASFLAEGDPQQAVATIGSEGCGDDLGAQLLRRRALRASGAGAPDQAVPSSAAVASAPLETRIERWLVLAGEAIDEQARDRAELCLDRALRLAVPEQLRRPFFEAPADVRELLDGGGRSARSRWLRTGVPGTAVLGCTDGPGEQAGSEPAQADPAVNPLTAKEQEVLGHLADLLATEEIAKTMFVSVNTVRSHVRSILRKLGVSRRNEAVRRAWELKLLPPRGAA